MKCLHPVWISYSPEIQFKRMSMLSDHGIPFDSRDEFVNGCYVPCGKCAVCKERRKSEWTLRNSIEFDKSSFAYFFTLTYDYEHLPLKKLSDGRLLPVVRRRDVQLFLKRLRKRLSYPIRFFLVSEYGPTNLRPHYHGIIYNLHPSDVDKIDASWGNGFTRVDQVTHGRIAYCSSYCFDDLDLTPDHEKNFLLCSRRPAIGHLDDSDGSVVEYIRSNMSNRFPMRSSDGTTYFYRLPKYFLEKIFSDTERFEIAVDAFGASLQARRKLENAQLEWFYKKVVSNPSMFNDYFDPFSHSYMIEVIMHTPFDTSPVGLAEQLGKEITRRCLEKRKMNKGKTPLT